MNTFSCPEPGNIVPDLNIDKPPSYCDKSCPQDPSQKDVNTRPDLSWLQEYTQKKMGIGQHAMCDPMQTGHIINEQGGELPNRNVVYRYSKAIRGCDEAMVDLFRDVIVLDEQNKAWAVPIIWATQEKAVASILQENVRKDNSLVVDRIKLPIMAIHSSGFNFSEKRYVYHKAVDYMRYLDPNRKPGFTTSEKYEKDTVFGVARGIPMDIEYTLWFWTMYQEDADQILEQLLLKFSPIAYIRVRGVPWEIGVRRNSIANNINIEPGDQAIRVIKYQLSLTAETYIPQPITRRKAVLRTETSIADGVEKEDVTLILSRLESAVKELEND